MKALASSILLLILLHVLAAVGFVAWLGASGRVNGERLDEVVEIFRPTITEDMKRQEEIEAAEKLAVEQRDQLLRLERVANGPQSIEDRLRENFETDEVSLHRLERLTSETAAIRRRLDQDKAMIAKEKAELEADRAAFETAMAERLEKTKEEDFVRAVKTLEQLPSKQSKEMIRQLVLSDKLEQAVDYLAAMQLRKSAGVLKAFKEERDIPLATQLVERLRMRGLDPLGRGYIPGEETTGGSS